jgi:HK97 family phage portal protein
MHPILAVRGEARQVGLIERIQAERSEQRVIGGVPWRPWDSPFWKFSQGGPVHPSRAFYGVDHALGLPALYSCVRLLSENLASLPLKIYTRSPSHTAPAIRYTGPSIFDDPTGNPDVTYFDWAYQLMTALLLHGNAWGLITGRDGYGFPTGIEWVPPDLVNVIDDPQQPWNPMRTRVYLYGRLVANWRDELFHVKAFTLPGRTEGISPLRAFAMTVMSGLEAQRYGTDWFAAGGFPPGTFQNNELEIDADAAAQIRESLTTAIRNKQPLVYGRDWDYKPVVVPPSEAQFIEATQMNATQMAAVYGLPPDRVGGARGDSLTYNTVEQSTLQVIEALRPWLVRIETAFFRLLPANRYCRFNADALLKTDLKTRTEIQLQQRQMGLMNIDELRDSVDLAPLAGQAGGENIPLEVMVAMARSIRGIPNSMLKGITLEMDLAADRLEKLQKEGLAKPAAEPSAQAPDVLLGNMVGAARGLENLGTDDMIALLRALARQGREAAGSWDKPEFVGPWISRDGAGGGSGDGYGSPDDGSPDDDPVNDLTVSHKPQIYTAHRIDETLGHLSHATERIQAARKTSDPDARGYEADHVITDVGQAQLATQRLIRNVRENYPRESAELDRVSALATPAGRAAAVSPAHKAATFAHLLQTSLHHEAHAMRHAQLLPGEAGDGPLWNFDAEHCARHVSGALEHVQKLAQHVRDNYPQEGLYLNELNTLEKDPVADTKQLARMNGNGRAHT